MSIDRFHPFTDEELHELRYGVKLACRTSLIAERPDQAGIADRLDDEIAHVQEQRRMALARERNPG